MAPYSRQAGTDEHRAWLATERHRLLLPALPLAPSAGVACARPV